MLHGEFNHFEGQGMEEDGPSVHETTLSLSPGKYKYYFVMGGQRRSVEEVADTYVRMNASWLF